MKFLKKSAITVIGLFLLLIGLVFVILPGPAFILIPIALALLSLEYPVAKTLLRKSQRLMSASAAKLDAFFRR